jgi:hypothetical protein
MSNSFISGVETVVLRSQNTAPRKVAWQRRKLQKGKSDSHPESHRAKHRHNRAAAEQTNRGNLPLEGNEHKQSIEWERKRSYDLIGGHGRMLKAFVV